ncbi:MAG: tRNA (guanosine(46)-N7)-methyltransferase TrmB [Lachnospiraceae bacterium]
MRLRKVKGAAEAIAGSRFVIHDATERKGHWQEVFGNSNPIYIEIGMGKGRFLTTLALKYPNINYVGIERYDSVLVRALEKREQTEEISNLFYLCEDAKNLTDIFAPGEVAGIYLNFSDPWPKDRHAKRRLTSTEFFARYDNILAKDGRVMFKTDNRGLFEFSLEQVMEAGWQLCDVTYDLHHSEFSEGNVMTEYEEKFSSLGNPICRLVAYR